MLKNPFTKPIVITICLAALCACSAGGYQRLEEKPLPRYQKGTPVMSDLKVMCRAKVEHHPGKFNLYYDDLWDVTLYLTPPNIPPRYNPKWCENGQSTILSTKVITNPHPMHPSTSPDNPSSIYNLPPNTDPEKGAVNLWELPHLSIDGLNYRATLISFVPFIMEGDKLPLGGYFTKFRTSPFTKKDTVNINGHEWQHLKWSVIYGRDIPAQLLYNKAGESSYIEELYSTKINNNNYTMMMFARYDGELVMHAPDWLAKRQAFLRHWLESFKFEPISSADYQPPSKEEASSLKESETKPHSAPTNPDKSRGVLSAPVR